MLANTWLGPWLPSLWAPQSLAGGVCSRPVASPPPEATHAGNSAPGVDARCRQKTPHIVGESAVRGNATCDRLAGPESVDGLAELQAMLGKVGTDESAQAACAA